MNGRRSFIRPQHLSDINVNQLVETFYKADKALTLTLARPTGRNVIVSIDEEGLYCGRGYNNKNNTQNAWVNANIMVCNNQVFHYLQKDEPLEKFFLENLMREKQIATYLHNEFWLPVETMRDRMELEVMWSNHMETWKAR